MGRAGFGKTALAKRVVSGKAVIDAFPGGVCWLSAGTPGPAGARLLIVDDAGDGREPPPGADGETRLILTRDRSLLSLPHLGHIEVGPIESAEALALLAANAPGIDLNASRDDLAAIVERLHRWPLALTLAHAELLRVAARAGILPALAVLKKGLERHGLTAFDPRGAAGADSVFERMDRMLAGLGEEPKKALLWLARGGGEGAEPEADAVRKLADLGLVEVDAQGSFGGIDPLLADFLRGQGLVAAPRSLAQSARDKVEVSSSQSLREPPKDVMTAEQALRDNRVLEDRDDAKKLAGKLKEMQFFGFARQYLALARATKFPGDRWFGQQHALCTYKDPDLPVDARLDRAIAILTDTDPPDDSQSSETLGIAGAIYKREWEADGKRENLERSFGYYHRGYQIEKNTSGDPNRYAGINAAYVLDLLAAAEQVNARIVSGTVRERRVEARAVREEIRATLAAAVEGANPGSKVRNWWNIATLAEACFGLGRDEVGNTAAWRYEEARYWIREGLALNPPRWEFESFARQLANIGRLHEPHQQRSDSPVTATLRVLLGDSEIAIESLRAGKMGLALSGGGFRAALFHIGVLARLAELDMLRHVEALSCVSGGSIIGAFYYLELQALLESKPDADIRREDYLEIVHKLETRFLEGVQRDVRNRLLSEWRTMWRSILGKEYSQTFRLGELLEEELYSRASDGKRGPRFLGDLAIQPKDANPGFAPKLDNWRRATKVPVLILNATTLNTGHNWQFTASWMGEPPSGINTEIDVNHRLRRMYYWQSATHPKIRLGQAVAASAAVPAIFGPIEFEQLHRGHLVRLSDGGVNDNQGTSALLGEDCSILLISDASGQLTTKPAPSSGHIGVLWRANEIFQERLRGLGHRDAAARLRAGLVRALFFVHLTKDLESEAVPWVGKLPPAEPPDVLGEGRDPKRTNYNVLREVQQALAGLRTDLDAFGDREAHALMLSGYLMTVQEFPRSVQQYRLPESDRPAEWKFQRLAAVMANTGVDEAPELTASLEWGADVAGKALRLNPGLAKTLVISGVCALAGGVAVAAVLCLRRPFAAWICGAAVAAAAAIVVRKARRLGKSWSQIGIALALGCGGAVAFKLYLRLLAPWYLEWGRGAVSQRSKMRIRWIKFTAVAAAIVPALLFLLLLFR